MIRVSRQGTNVSLSFSERAALQETFAQTHAIRLTALLDPELVTWALDHIGELLPVRHGDIASELATTRGPAVDLLTFLVNDPILTRCIEDLCGCRHIGSFYGRVYRMHGAEHHDSWHTDDNQTRLVAMSINLGEPYLGGLLQIRDTRTHALLGEHSNLGPGDALLFRISESLEHQVTSVTGSQPKTAFSGWFREKPEFRDVLAGLASF